VIRLLGFFIWSCVMMGVVALVINIHEFDESQEGK
jgi:heme exporter protein D